MTTKTHDRLTVALFFASMAIFAVPFIATAFCLDFPGSDTCIWLAQHAKP